MPGDCECNKENVVILEAHAHNIRKIISLLNDQIGRIFSLLEKHFAQVDKDYENIAEDLKKLGEYSNKLGEFCSDNFSSQLEVFKEFVQESIVIDESLDKKMDEILTLLKNSK